MPRWTEYRCAATIGLLALALYLPHADHAFIDIDDGGFITQNPLVRDASASAMVAAFGSFTELLYLPLTVISWQLNAMAGGMHPLGFHLIDGLLHALNAALLFLLLDRLTATRWPAFIAAVLFAVHPLNAEAVLWASARKDLLSAAFSLLALLAYLRAVDDGSDRRWPGVALYACALLAKISVFPLPLLFPLIERLRDRPWSKGMFLRLWPYFLAAAPLILLGAYGGSQFLLPLGAWPFVALAGKATAFTLLQAVWPAWLSIVHYQPEPIAASAMHIGSVAILGVLWVGFLVLIFRARAKTATLGIGITLLMVAPTYAAAQKAGLLFFASDKYAYMPLMGLALILASGLAWLQRRHPFRFRIAAMTSILATIPLAIVTSLYAPAWKDAASLHTHVLAADPENPVSLNNLGLLTIDSDPAAAFAFFERAIEAEPRYAVPYVNAASAKLKLGDRAGMVDFYSKIAPILTARELRGDRQLVKAMLAVEERLRQAGRAEDARRLRERVVELAPEVVPP